MLTGSRNKVPLSPPNNSLLQETPVCVSRATDVCFCPCTCMCVSYPWSFKSNVIMPSLESRTFFPPVAPLSAVKYSQWHRGNVKQRSVWILWITLWSKNVISQQNRNPTKVMKKKEMLCDKMLLFKKKLWKTEHSPLCQRRMVAFLGEKKQ